MRITLQTPLRIVRRAAVFASLPLFLLAGCTADAPEDDAADEATSEQPTAESESAAGASLVVEGFSTPESVLHDPASDVYLVSNISGAPTEKDDDGFISRVSPAGDIVELRWIDSATEGVTLHAPKGMAIAGDRLYVTDIDVLRVFDLASGDPVAEHPVEGAAFLNDVAADEDGTIWFTDTGVDAAFESTGADAVHALRDGMVETVSEGTALMSPNGIAVDADGLVVVPFGGASLLRVSEDGSEPSEIATLPGGQLDGVIALPDGGYLVSSWETGVVYRVGPDGSVESVMEDVQAPADIGWDAQRSRLLVPLFMDGRVEIVEF